MAAVVAIPLRLILANPQLRFDVQTNDAASFVFDVARDSSWPSTSFLMVFNLLPIPPLDGWRALLGLVDARTAYTLRQFEQYGFIADPDLHPRRRAVSSAASSTRS